MHVGLLACDEVADRFRHIAGGYQQMFERLLSPHTRDLRVTRFDVRAGEMPTDARAYEAWITTGSRASVYDDAEWIRTSESFVKEIADADVPFAGICFGHQLLARVLGADVTRAPRGWGVGVLPMRVVRDAAWIDPKVSTVRMQYMHADQVIAPPDGATLLGEAPHCPVAMFQCGARLIGIQGHPEFTAVYARALIEDRRARIGEPAATNALSTVDEPTDAALIGGWIARFFATS